MTRAMPLHDPATLKESPNSGGSDGKSTKNPDTVSLGQRGGKIGGRARASALSPERRSEIAKQGAAKRWGASPPLPEASQVDDRIPRDAAFLDGMVAGVDRGYNGLAAVIQSMRENGTLEAARRRLSPSARAVVDAMAAPNALKDP